MHDTRLLLPAMCLVGMVAMAGFACDARLLCDGVPTKRLDRSSFEVFSFSRRGAGLGGACFPVGEVFDVRIERTGETTYVVDLSIVSPTQLPEQPTIDGIVDLGLRTDLVVLIEPPSRVLTSEETERMRTLFSSVSIKDTLANEMASILKITLAGGGLRSHTACLVERFRWDELEMSSVRVNAGVELRSCPLIDEDEVEVMVAFLNDLYVQ